MNSLAEVHRCHSHRCRRGPGMAVGVARSRTATVLRRSRTGPHIHAVDGSGLPLTVAVTAANVNDSTMFEALMDDVPAVRTPSGRRRCRPGTVHADRGMRPALPRLSATAWDQCPDRAPRDRVVEAAGPLPLAGGTGLLWLSCFRRLQVRWGMPMGWLRTYPSCCDRCAPQPEGPRGRTARAVLHDRPPGHPVLATALGWSAACGAGSVCDGRLPVVGQCANSG
jgi:hypothetical protein